MTQYTLHYVYDLMCSWCYAFQPVWNDIKKALPTTIDVVYHVGGLAPDSDIPMPNELQKKLQSTWRHISQSVPGIEFNHDFWNQCVPRRSTYPACRAVLAAKRQDRKAEDAMIVAIQKAYYQDAQNPSDSDTLIACADTIGLDVQQFQVDMQSADIEQALSAEIRFARSIGGNSFPSLFLCDRKNYHPIQISYLDKEMVLSKLTALTTIEND